MINTFKRYEKKFLINSSQFEKLIPLLDPYMEKDKYCKNGENYQIYNVYYDTDDNSIIRHSLSKPYYKEKLRMRSYFTPKSQEDTVFLELKKKIGGIVTKRRVIIPLKDAKNFIQYGIKPQSDDYITSQVLNEIEYFLKINQVKPTAYIAYTRIAFFGKDDPELRITFDNKIITRRTSTELEYGCFGSELLKHNEYLMEIKISGAMPIWLADILSSLEIYPCSFSKYGTEYKKHCYLKDIPEKSVVNI